MARAELLIESIRTMSQCEGSYHREIDELYKELKQELWIGNADDKIGDLPTKFLVNELKKRTGIETHDVDVSHYAKLSVNNELDGSLDTITGPAQILVVRD